LRRRRGRWLHAMCLLCVAAAATAGVGEAAVAAPPPGPLGKPAFIVANFVSPVLFSFFGINVYSYGLMVAAALGIAFWVFSEDLSRARLDLDEMNCFFVFLAGFGVGSKAHLALSAVGAGEPLTWKAFDIRTGHSFIGSQLGAVFAMLIFIRRKNVGVLAFLDVLLPCCILGHVIGKIGCFLSGDGCYGPFADPTRVPWAMSFPNALVPTREPVHPTPLYEAALSLTIFILVRCSAPLPPLPDDTTAAGGGGKQEANISGSASGTTAAERASGTTAAESKKPTAVAVATKVGRRTSLVLVFYGFGRVVVEQFRRHPPINLFGGITEYQALAVALLIVGIVIEIVTTRLQQKRHAAPVKQKAQ